MGKAIYADYKIGQAYHAIDADIKGECKTRKAIFTDCKATIRHDGHSVEKPSPSLTSPAATTP